MNNNNNHRLKKYVSLRNALQREKAQLEARLAQLNAALGISASAAAPAAEAPRKKVPSTGGVRQMSAEARAKIAEAQRARWAARKGQNGVSTKPAKAGRGRMTPEHRAKIAAAQRARWAKYRASKSR